jgi:hypothetical protein
MEIQERQLVLDQLASSEARLLELVEGLTPEQWSFRETPERSSIAEISGPRLLSVAGGTGPTRSPPRVAN